MLPSSPSADYISDATLRLCFGRAVFCCPFPGELGSTTAHLRRLPRKGRAGGAQNPCSSIACRAQPCQRCSPVLQALIIFQMQFYGSASAEPFFVAPFPENWGARLRISGGCPARGEPEALLNPCSSIACRAQPCQRCSPVLQALIIFQCAFLRLCFGRAVFCCPFPGELGSTTAHLRRLPRKGRARGAFKSLLKHRVLKQKAWVCVYSANFL